MNLGEVALGRPVTITHVGGERAFRRRLMELGILPGTQIEVVRVAPLGDPIELRVRGCSLSIRRAEARTISVVAVAAAPARAEVCTGFTEEANAPARPVSLRPGLPASP